MLKAIRRFFDAKRTESTREQDERVVRLRLLLQETEKMLDFANAELTLVKDREEELLAEIERLNSRIGAINEADSVLARENDRLAGVADENGKLVDSYQLKSAQLLDKCDKLQGEVESKDRYIKSLELNHSDAQARAYEQIRNLVVQRDEAVKISERDRKIVSEVSVEIRHSAHKMIADGRSALVALNKMLEPLDSAPQQDPI